MTEKSLYHLADLNNFEFWLELEKYWNSGSPSGFGINLPDPYDPKSRPGLFSVPVFEVPWDKATRIGSYPPGFQSPNQLDIEYVPIHPLCINDQFTKKKPVFLLDCTATSSGRTLALIYNNKLSSFLKLHFPKCLGRFERSIPLYCWSASISISADIQNAFQDIPECSAFLLETGGIYVENDSSNFGSIFRTSKPFPDRPYEKIVPAFSLVMNESRKSNSIDLLHMIFGSNLDSDLFIQFAIVPIIETYTWLSFKRGLIPECNSQNVLFCLDTIPLTKPWVVVLRDFADFFVDLEIRNLNKLHDNFTRYKVVGGWSIENDLLERRSFAFDYKLGEYLLKPLIDIACEAYHWNKSDIQELIKEIFRKKIPTKDYFYSENTWFRYPKSKHVSRLKYERVDSAPAFR